MGRLFILTGAGLLASGCATTAPTGPAGTPTLVVDDMEERALLLLLADRQTWEPVSLSTALEGGPAVRQQLALTVARIGDERGTDMLVGLLGDSDPSVRQAAAFGLGLLPIGDGAGVVALLGAVNDPDRETGRLAVEALARLGLDVESTVEQLIQGSANELFPRLLPSLFRFQSRDDPQPAVVRWAVEGLAEEDPELHTMAAYALARQPVPEAAEALRGLLADPDPWIRGWAARGLGEVGNGDDLPALVALLGADSGPTVQALRAAARLIGAGQAAAPMDWQPRILELMADPRPGVRLTAIEASAAWLLDGDIEARLFDLTQQGHPREQELALMALAEGESTAASGAVLTAARLEDPALRRAAVRAGGLLGDTKLLEDLAGDSHPAVRAAVLDTWFVTGTNQANVDRAATALLDEDAGVRATALEWVIDHPVLDVEILSAAEQLSRRDRLTDARVAAVRALGRRAAAVPAEKPAAVAYLLELAGDRDLVVQRAAADAATELGSPTKPGRSAARQRPVDTYRDVVRRTAKPRRVELETSHGTVTLELACPEAPLTCLNFLQLAGQGFYDGLPFHRVVPDFVVQAGDPRGDGRGGPGYMIRDELNLLRYRRGTVGMALSGPDTGGSQFFIALSPQPHLDGGYTVFGSVVGGIEALDRVVQGDQILKIREAQAPSR